MLTILNDFNSDQLPDFNMVLQVAMTDVFGFSLSTIMIYQSLIGVTGCFRIAREELGGRSIGDAETADGAVRCGAWERCKEP